MAGALEVLMDSEAPWRWWRLLIDHDELDFLWKQGVSQPRSVSRLLRSCALPAVVLVLVIKKVPDLLSLYVVL